MIRFTFLAVSLFGSALVTPAAEPISVRDEPEKKSQVKLETLIAFPEEYIGQTLCIDKGGQIYTELKRDKELEVFFIKVRSGDFRIKTIEGLDFAISEKMAKQLIDAKDKFPFSSDGNYNAIIRFKIIEKTLSANRRKTIAMIDLIDISDPEFTPGKGWRVVKVAQIKE